MSEEKSIPKNEYKLTPTSIITVAAVWACPKAIVCDDGSVEHVAAFDLMNVTVKPVEGRENRTKMIFWFRWDEEMKRVVLAHSNHKILVDPNTFHQKYLDFRNMAFNKGFALKPGDM